MLQEKILLLGFGDIASRLTEKLAPKNYQLTGVRRSPFHHPLATVVRADCCDSREMSKLLSQSFDVIVMTMTPGEYTDPGYRQAYVVAAQSLMEALARQAYQPRLILFVSSSSVYAQNKGEWVDEQSNTEPSSFSGKRLLEAEHIFTKSIYQTCIVRFAGIYGPGRKRLIEQVVEGKGVAEKPVLYSNRIHADDCAGVLAHLIELGKNSPLEEIYLAADCEPSPLHEVKQWIANELNLPQDHLQASTVNRQLRSSKRCSNQRLLDSGYPFLYPNFRAGYGQVLKEFRSSY